MVSSSPPADLSSSGAAAPLGGLGAPTAAFLAAAGPSTTARRSGSTGDDYRVRRHMLVFDGGVLAASGLILFSIATNWYEKGFIVDGARETVTRHLLSGNAGIQRPLLPILAGFTVVEVVLNMRWLRASQRAWRAHRGVVLLLCAVQLVLVVSCMLSSPLWAASLANIGISINAGPGGWIALGGAVIGLLAAVGRAFAGRTALGRSAPLPGRPRGLAGS